MTEPEGHRLLMKVLTKAPAAGFAGAAGLSTGLRDSSSFAMAPAIPQREFVAGIGVVREEHVNWSKSNESRCAHARAYANSWWPVRTKPPEASAHVSALGLDERTLKAPSRFPSQHQRQTQPRTHTL
jgi:hypothetical protein